MKWQRHRPRWTTVIGGALPGRRPPASITPDGMMLIRNGNLLLLGSHGRHC